jgi:hypothetical protein
MKRSLITIMTLALIGTALWAVSPAKSQRVHKSAGTAVMVPVVQEKNLNKILLQRYSRTELSTGVYVGSEFCLACHTGLNPETPEWRDTKHAYVLRQPMGMYSLEPGKGVMADYNNNGIDDFKEGLDFNTISSALDARKPNAPILSYDAATDSYFIQLGPGGLKLKVVATWAGQSEGNGQRYMCRVPVSDTATGYSNAIYFAPFAWDGSAYSDSTKYWYNGITPKYAPGITTAALGDPTTGLQSQNYMKTCIGCHITGIRKAYVAPSGEYVVNPYPASLVPNDSPNYPDLDGDGLPDLAGIGCESCHGPGSQHILGGGDPTKIVNPADISNNQQRSVTCLQCHVQIASAPTQKWGFTYDEADNKPFVMTNPPDDLANYQVFTGGMWPDGQHFVSSRIDDFKTSDHYLGSHGIACNDCHNAHAETQNDAQVRDSITRSGTTYPNTNVDDDSFCMGCHHSPYFLPSVSGTDVVNWKASGFEAPIPDKIRNAIESHTHHPYGAANPDGSARILGQSRCITCHMAPTSGHGTSGGHSHTFWPASPEDTINLANEPSTGTTYGATGQINSCSSTCHRGNVRIWQDVPAIPDWTNNKYNTPDELKLAGHLVQYFGPGGQWWDTGSAAKASAKAK